ncbi:MAG: right-handed parallel beta-helix repeat-containing protein [Chthoniobacteraceae bacterium]
MKLLRLIPLLCTFAAFAQTPEKPKRLDASTFPSLQAAFDALPASGGIVVIPPGDYDITEPLRIRTAETRIEGSGASTHIRNKNEAGEPALVLAPPTIDTDKKARLWRVQVGNLRISGNPKSGDGIFAHGIQEIFLQGVSIDHHGRHGIHLLDCYEDPRVNDSILTYNAASGLHISGAHDIVVSGNHFEENLDAITCHDAFNLCANGNNIDDHLRHGIVIENTYGSVVSGNMIEECNGTAIILDRDCYGIALSANVIAHHLEGGIDLRDAWGCSVSANTFVLCHKFSVRVGPAAGRSPISGNAFTNSFMGDGQKRPAEAKTPMGIDAAGGVVLEGAKDVLISGNTFTGLDREAVIADTATERVLVNGNLLTDCARKLDAGAKWIVIDAAKDSIARDNLGAK